jgi:hypothetical protein
MLRNAGFRCTGTLASLGPEYPSRVRRVASALGMADQVVEGA